MTTIFFTKSRHHGKPRNEFGTDLGITVYYNVTSYDDIHGDRSIIQPLDTEARADWAIRVLSLEYPTRTYTKLKMYTQKGMTSERLEPFLQLVLDDLTKLEIAHRYGIGSE